MFLRLYKTEWPQEIFDVLDGLFADVDDFCSDPDLRMNVGGIDELELRRRATLAFELLSVLAG